MPEYLSPGVYVEEIDAGPKPIEGVSTSTAGAIGITARGPTTGKPVLVTSFLQFERTFGGFLPEPPAALLNTWALNDAEGGRWWQFPLSVRGFFDNGGQRLYVKRVFSSTALTAALPLARGLAAEVVRDAPATATELRLRHTIGIANNTSVRLFVNGLVAPGTFKVLSYTAGGSVTLDNPVGQEVKAGRDFLEVVKRGTVADVAADERLTVRAKASGDWGGNEQSETGILAGNGLRVRVRPMTGAALKMLGSATVGGPPASSAVLTLAEPGDTVIDVRSIVGLADGDHVSVDGAEYVITAVPTQARINLDANLPAAVALPMDVLQGGQVVARLVSPGILGDNFVRVDTVANINPDPAHKVDIDGTLYKVTSVAHANITIDAPGVPAGNPWEPGTSVRRLRPANKKAPPGRVISVQNAAQLYPGAIVELDNGTVKEVLTVDSVTGDDVTLSGDIANDYYEGHRMRLVEGEITAQYLRDHIPVAEETFSNLRFLDDGGPNYILRHVNEESTLIDLEAGQNFNGSVATLAELPSLPEPDPATDPQRFWGDLEGGRDNLDGLSVDDFVGVEGGSENSTGIQSLEYIDEISICLAPGMWASSVQSGLITHCETLKDRFAILDPPDDLDIEGIRGFREPLDTKYAALYYPHLVVRDPSLKRDVNLAPSGHMAGLYARVDVERGVHKAPANEVVRGIRRFAVDISKREQDMLNPRNINALRAFPGRGLRVWGARTLSSDASWKYINVRRLFLFVEESIDEGTQWVVFEPNDEPLWARVVGTIREFLRTVWLSGALEGSKPNEAFFVKCDRTTMTQADIDNGRLICVIGIAPVKPAEFVIFRIQQKTRDDSK
jgi:phage tail sheath protein FI